MATGTYKLKTTTLNIQKFRDRTSAQKYLKFQRAGDNPMKGAHVRMRKYPAHEWANRVGNIAVIKVDHDPLSDIYLFEDGYHRYEFQDGTERLDD